MNRLHAFLQNVTPLAMALAGGAVLSLLMAFALVWTSLNEYRSGTGFRRVLKAYGTGAPEMAAEDLPEVIAAKPRRYPYPKLLLALLKIRSRDVAGATGLYQEVLDERETLLAPREKALCYNGLGVAAVLGAKEAKRSEALAQAHELFEKAAQAWPQLPESYLNLAALALAEDGKMRKEDPAKLLASAAEPGRLPPGMDGVRAMALLRMMVAEQAGNSTEAVTQARCFLAYRPLEIESRTVLARALGRQAARQASPVFDPGPTECGDMLEVLVQEAAPAARPHDLAEAACGAARFRMEALWAAHLATPDFSAQTFSAVRRHIGIDLDLACSWAPEDPAVRALRCVQFARDMSWLPDGPEPSARAARYQAEFQFLAGLKVLDDPVRAVAENDLGVLMGLQSHEADALPHLERATQLAPASAAAALNRAVVLDRLGRREDAKTWYAKSLALKPDQGAVKARLDFFSQKAAAP